MRPGRYPFGKHMRIRFSVKIIFAYIASFITANLLGVILWMLVNSGAVSQGVRTLDLNYFLEALHAVFPIALSACPVFVSFYLIRHPEVSSFSIAIFFVIHLCAWVFLVPLMHDLSGAALPHSPSGSSVDPSLLIDRFEASDSGSYVVFYSKADTGTGAGSPVVSGVCLDQRYGRGGIYTFADAEVSDADRLTAEAGVPAVLQAPVNYFTPFVNSIYAASASVLSWALFSTITLAIGGVLFFRNISVWRLVNTLWVLALYVFVLAVNFIIGSSPSGNFTWVPNLSRLITPQQVLAAAVNIVILLICIPIGIITRRRKFKSAGLDDEEQAIEGGIV